MSTRGKRTGFANDGSGPSYGTVVKPSLNNNTLSTRPVGSVGANSSMASGKEVGGSEAENLHSRSSVPSSPTRRQQQQPETSGIVVKLDEFRRAAALFLSCHALRRFTDLVNSCENYYSSKGQPVPDWFIAIRGLKTVLLLLERTTPSNAVVSEWWNLVSALRDHVTSMNQKDPLYPLFIFTNYIKAISFYSGDKKRAMDLILKTLEKRCEVQRNVWEGRDNFLYYLKQGVLAHQLTSVRTSEEFISSVNSLLPQEVPFWASSQVTKWVYFARSMWIINQALHNREWDTAYAAANSFSSNLSTKESIARDYGVCAQALALLGKAYKTRAIPDSAIFDMLNEIIARNWSLPFPSLEIEYKEKQFDAEEIWNKYVENKIQRISFELTTAAILILSVAELPKNNSGLKLFLGACRTRISRANPYASYFVSNVLFLADPTSQLTHTNLTPHWAYRKAYSDCMSFLPEPDTDPFIWNELNPYDDTISESSIPHHRTLRILGLLRIAEQRPELRPFVSELRSFILIKAGRYQEVLEEPEAFLSPLRMYYAGIAYMKLGLNWEASKCFELARRQTGSEQDYRITLAQNTQLRTLCLVGEAKTCFLCGRLQSAVAALDQLATVDEVMFSYVFPCFSQLITVIQFLLK